MNESRTVDLATFKRPAEGLYLSGGSWDAMDIWEDAVSVGIC